MGVANGDVVLGFLQLGGYCYGELSGDKRVRCYLSMKQPRTTSSASFNAADPGGLQVVITLEDYLALDRTRIGLNLYSSSDLWKLVAIDQRANG